MSLRMFKASFAVAFAFLSAPSFGQQCHEITPSALARMDKSWLTQHTEQTRLVLAICQNTTPKIVRYFRATLHQTHHPKSVPTSALAPLRHSEIAFPDVMVTGFISKDQAQPNTYTLKIRIREKHAEHVDISKTFTIKPGHSHQFSVENVNGVIVRNEG